MDVRRLLLASAALLLLAGCASGAARHARTGSDGSGPSAAGGRPPAASTISLSTVRTFTPYDAHGRLTVPVQSRRRGHCWEISLAAPAAGTYRCLAGNTILDPCFAASRTAHRVACFTDPWSDAVVLRLHRLPRGAPLTARPWAVVLAGGRRCVAATGTAPFVRGVGLGYACTGGTAAALRNLGSAHVHALVGRSGGHTLHRVAVTTLWRA